MVKPNKKASKLTWPVVLAAAVLLAAVLLWSPWAPAETASPAEAQAPSAELPMEVAVEESYELVESGAFLLDVRTQEEWDEFHAPQATLIPLDELAGRLNEIPKDKPVVIICRSGNRSAVARDYLLDAGFGSVTSSAGGMLAWQAAGYPVE